MTALAAVVAVTNMGFTAWFDTALKIPVVVEYDLEPAEVMATNRVPNPFRGDPRIPGTDLGPAYSGSGYDRGHMAPAGDFNWSPDALKETYFYSNVCPQSPNLNRGRWLDAEKATREMAASGTVHVVNVAFPGTGTVNGVNVPRAFLKVSVGPDGMRWWLHENR